MGCVRDECLVIHTCTRTHRCMCTHTVRSHSLHADINAHYLTLPSPYLTLPFALSAYTLSSSPSSHPCPSPAPPPSPPPLTHSALAEWNLPACIEETGDDAVPESILEKSKAVKEQGGLAKLDELMSEMPELVTRNKEILAEVNRCTRTQCHTHMRIHTHMHTHAHTQTF